MPCLVLVSFSLPQPFLNASSLSEKLFTNICNCEEERLWHETDPKVVTQVYSSLAGTLGKYLYFHLSHESVMNIPWDEASIVFFPCSLFSLRHIYVLCSFHHHLFHLVAVLGLQL